MNCNTIIIGAGIAGLGASYALRSNGFSLINRSLWSLGTPLDRPGTPFRT